ncbi:plastocyanin/azurin family copper-binding protein [Fodinibius sp. Rm-B-1B1-1]|uniref:plastocyanin/azurin family copper-binding protein n=1 Tax=Fodinibius alkaliphilus TaxID=3140241 RepID=UPI003159C24B
MTRFAPYLLSLVLLFVTACGGGSDQQQTENQTAETQATEQTDNIRTIEVIGIDRMKYVVENDAEGITTGDEVGDYLLLESITAAPGEELRIRLHTESEMPAQAMSHNFVLLTMDADAQAFANAAAQARDNEYIPADREDQIIAHSDLAAGGETVEVTFTVPEETGEYDYLCSFTGHFAGGMVGTLNVEE